MFAGLWQPAREYAFFVGLPPQHITRKEYSVIHPTRPRAGRLRATFTRAAAALPVFALCAITSSALARALPAQQMSVETRDPKQAMDETFAKSYREWTVNSKHGSPLVDHLPIVKGIPTPREVLGYHIGAPKKLTYYVDQLKYYRALAAATPRVRVETIGKSDEGRELVVVWVSSDANINGFSLASTSTPLAASASTSKSTNAGLPPRVL